MNLRRPPERVLSIGHRGAASLAPENTLATFRTAVTHGVDLVEFDVVDLPRGPLIVAHSLELAELTHEAESGSAAALTLDELRHLVPELPTFDEALHFFATEARDVGLHLDLKLDTRLGELVEAIVRHGLEDRVLVTTPVGADLRSVGSACPRLSLGLTYPADRPAISRRGYLAPVIRLVVRLMRLSLRFRIVRLAHAAGADTVTLQHRVVGPRAVARAHAAGLAVFAWTVDDPKELARVVAAGVDGVVSNDPRLLQHP